MAMLDKIVAGKVNKRLQEISLSGQTHMAVEGGPVIEKYLQGLSKEIGVQVTLDSFTRWALGQTHSE
jgi:translation elongation factor EF-Ts